MSKKVIEFRGKNTVAMRYVESWETLYIDFKKDKNNVCFRLEFEECDDEPIDFNKTESLSKFLNCDLDKCTLNDIFSWIYAKDSCILTELDMDSVDLCIPYEKSEVRVNVDYFAEEVMLSYGFRNTVYPMTSEMYEKDIVTLARDYVEEIKATPVRKSGGKIKTYGSKCVELTDVIKVF